LKILAERHDRSETGFLQRHQTPCLKQHPQ
jgi:hypothetical protein